MPPKWISVAVTPVVVLPVTGGTVPVGMVAGALAAGGVVAAAPVCGVLVFFLLPVHAPRTIRLAAVRATPFLIKDTQILPGIHRPTRGTVISGGPGSAGP